MSNLKTLVWAIFLIPGCIFAQREANGFFQIPPSTVSISTSVAEGLDQQAEQNSSADRSASINGFEVGFQITFREYKRFLAAVRQDSGEAAYRNLLPDSTIGTTEQYHRYLLEAEYDDFPVVGISWENALRYCVWRSMQEISKPGTHYLYRLPTMLEWNAAFEVLKGVKNTDFNQDYADWLMDAFYENSFMYAPAAVYGYDKSDRLSHRRRFIGNSYFISFRDPASFRGLYQYASQGHPFLGFRCVREQTELDSQVELMEYYKKTWHITL